MSLRVYHTQEKLHFPEGTAGRKKPEVRFSPAPVKDASVLFITSFLLTRRILHPDRRLNFLLFATRTASKVRFPRTFRTEKKTQNAPTRAKWLATLRSSRSFKAL